MDTIALAHLTSWAPLPNGYNKNNKFVVSLVEQLLCGNFEIVFDTFLKKFGLSWSSKVEHTVAKSASDLERGLGEFVVDNQQFTTEILLFSVACLQCYSQANFTGPPLNEAILPPELKIACESSSFIDFLTVDGEPAYVGMSRPDLLVIASILLSRLVESGSTDKELHVWVSWWLARCLCVHQATLANNSNTLHERIFSLLKPLSNEINGLSEIESDLRSTLLILLNAELARAHIIYDESALSSLQVAQTESGLVTLLTGMKGKKTKYQVHETTQLVFLSAVDKNVTNQASNNTTSESSGPKALDLNSDLFLERPSFSAQTSDEIPEVLKHIDPSEPPVLDDIDTALVLLRIAHTRRSSPHQDKLIGEEMMAMVESIVRAVPKGKVNWTLFSRALWERSVIESDSPRTVERGVLQMQSLVEELGYVSNKYIANQDDENTSNDLENASVRLRYFHLISPVPKWGLDSALADKFMSIGALKSAVEVYERLQMWGDLALCYAAVGEAEKGIELLKKHVEEHPTDARSISILGDITCDPELWQRSWDVGKYPAAKRSLGRYYYSSQAKGGRNLDLCIKHLREGLMVNPLNESAWFLYGCAGLETSQWELAAEAFTRCVSIDYDSPKAWSNLATAQLNMDRKDEALAALRQATRLSGQEKVDWRIWSNYVAVACDLDQWNDVLLGLRRITTLRGEKDGEDCLDVTILSRLVNVLVGETYIEDTTKTGGTFQRSAIDLFVNIIPKLVTSNAQLWRLVSKVHIWLKQPWAALEDIEKGFRIYTHIPDIESNEEKWNEAVEYCTDLVDAYRNYGPMEGKYGSEPVCKTWQYKAKSSVRLLMGRGKQSWEGTDSWDQLVELKDDL